MGETKQTGHQNALELLRDVQRRSGMWFTTINPESLTNFLNGLYAGLRIYGVLLPNRDDYAEAMKQLGLEHSSNSLHYFKNQDKMTNDEVYHKMLSVEIEAWTRHLERVGKG